MTKEVLATLVCRGVDGELVGLLVYEVTVYTSDIRGAGTDANVGLEIWGDKVRPVVGDKVCPVVGPRCVAGKVRAVVRHGMSREGSMVCPAAARG